MKRLDCSRAISACPSVDPKRGVTRCMAPGSIVLVGTSPWVYALVAIDAAIVLLIAGGVLWIILRGRKKA